MSRVEQIGRATLYLGDCLSVMPSLEPASVDMIWTDPPYGHSNHEGDWNSRLNDHRGIEGKPIANDDAESMRNVVDGMLTEAVRLLKPDCCCCCCCCGGGPRPTFAWVANRMDQRGLSFFHSVIWDKINPGLGWRYRRQHEMVMVAHREGGRLSWADDQSPIANVIRMSAPRGEAREHPNEKPIHLAGQFIQAHTMPGQLVMDPFMGSGSTGVMAVQMGRDFIGIELDPEHFATACRRIEDAQRQGSLFDGEAA